MKPVREIVWDIGDAFGHLVITVIILFVWAALAYAIIDAIT